MLDCLAGAEWNLAVKVSGICQYGNITVIARGWNLQLLTIVLKLKMLDSIGT